MTKLTDVQVREIRRLFKTKMMKQKEMAIKYGVSLATINNVIAKRAYKHVVDEEIDIDQERPYPCRVQEGCLKCFKNSSLRSAHERRHTKPYKCSTCEVGYATKDEMKFCERKHKNKLKDEKVIIPDIFTLLDLSERDVYDEKTLKRKYKKAVLKYHPDKGGNEELFIKVQSFKDKLCELIEDDEMVEHYIDQRREYNEYKAQRDKYDSQSELRTTFNDITKKMNETRHLKGTADEGYKELRRQQYKLKKDLVDKPSYYPREFGQSVGSSLGFSFSWC